MNFELIETNRLLLKGISSDNMKSIFNNLSKSDIKKALGHRSEEDYITELNKHKNGYSSYNRSFILFLLIEKEYEIIIGRCGLHNWNVLHNRAEIGYVINDVDFKRKGFMTEAAQAIINFGFNTLKLNRIEALVGSNNIPSLRIMEKFNFIKEGLLRQHIHVGDQYEDTILFSKLLNEYRA